jgi:CBS domain containing-hemolysin-like protein
MESIRADMDPGSLVEAVRSLRGRILPVCGQDLDDIHGVIYARDAFLQPAPTLATTLRPVHFVPEQIKLAHLLRDFRETQRHFAIVVDEYGGTAGFVTVEDVVEWIVGDLPEYGMPHAAPLAERVDERTYRLRGDLSIRDWADRFAVGEIDHHIDTLGGLILSKLGRVPRPGDVVRVRNLTLTVEAMRARRIDRVLLRSVAAGSESPTRAGGAA